MNASRSTTGAVLLDVDGTLVDSNYLHVDAWVRAFRLVGHEVDAWRVHGAIGMGSPQLIASLVGDDEAERVGDDVTAHHSALYLDLAERLRPFDGARDLIKTIADRGARPVLATSAAPAELERLRAVLDVDDYLYAVTGGGDVDAAKPEPDLVHAALEAAGVPPERAVMLGDSRWDVIAAGRAGVVCVGLRSRRHQRGGAAGTPGRSRSTTTSRACWASSTTARSLVRGDDGVLGSRCPLGYDSSGPARDVGPARVPLG